MQVMVYVISTQLACTQPTTTTLTKGGSVMQAHTQNTEMETRSSRLTLKLVKIALLAIIVRHLVWHHKFVLLVITSQTLEGIQVVGLPVMVTIRCLEQLSSICVRPVTTAQAQIESLENAQSATTQVMGGCHVLNALQAICVLVV
jgi:hypothetical protein